jgi:hypothetical protein
MPRPAEYENLIKIKAFEEVLPTTGAVKGFLDNAKNYLEACELLPEEKTLQIFTMAYEGYFQIVQAILEHHGVRTKDAGRNLAIQRVSSDLKLTSAEMPFVIRAHERRNNTAYRSPFPPVSDADAQAMVSILKKYLPVAMVLTGLFHKT